MKRTFRISSVILLVTLPFLSLSQNETYKGFRQHKFNIEVSSALTILTGRMNEGSKKAGIGNSFGINYIFMKTKNIGFATGIEIAGYRTRTTLPGFRDNYIISDADNEQFDFAFSLNSATEKQYIRYLNIPLMVQYHGVRNLKFFVSAGFKFGIPLKSTYKTENINVKTSAYYPLHDMLIEDLSLRGFGYFDMPSKDDQLKLRVTCNLSMEFGYKLNIGRISTLYLSAFVDYGLNDIRKNKNDLAYIEYNYDKATDFITNSMIHSYSREIGEPFMKRAAFLRTGIKIKYGF